MNAILPDLNNHSEPTAQDVDAAYGPILTSLFSGDAADKAAKWLHVTAAAGGGQDLSFNDPDASNPNGSDEIVINLLAGSLTVIGGPPGKEVKPGKPSALSSSIDELQRYGEGQGMLCHQDGVGLNCNGNPVVPAHTIGLRGIEVSKSEGGHPGNVQLVVNGPPDTPENFATATATAARSILQQALEGANQSAEVDRAVRWIRSEGDGTTHSMVFAGLTVEVSTVAQQPIEGPIIAEDLLIQPASVFV